MECAGGIKTVRPQNKFHNKKYSGGRGKQGHGTVQKKKRCPLRTSNSKRGGEPKHERGGDWG